MKKFHPRVSILIPTFNQAEYVKKAIQSALAQDYQPLEVVAADDCSTDETYEIISRFTDERLKVYRNQENLGIAGNYRRLLYELADGEWVLMLDGDDYLIWDRYISHCIERIAAEVSLVLAFANVYKGRNAEMKSKYNYPPVFNGKILLKHFWEGPGKIQHTTALYNRQAAMELDFYGSDRITTDFESLLKLAATGKVGFVEKPAAVHRDHPGRMNKTASYKRWIEDYCASSKELLEFVLERGGGEYGIDRLSVEKLHYRRRLEVARTIAEEGDFQGAEEIL